MDNNFTQDEQTFGRDLIDAAQRWVQPVVDRRVAQLEQQVTELKGQLAHVAVTAAQQRVQATLDADPGLGPRWRKLNSDPGFLRWLDEIDGLSGERRSVLLRRGYDRGHDTTVANFFRAFVTSQVAPERVRTGQRAPYETAPVPPSAQAAPAGRQRRWTRKEIAQFYRDKTSGLYDGRPAEAAQIEQDIVAAAQTGRVADPEIQVM